MTGFARQEGSFGEHSWAVEVKSVNGRSLDIRFRLPPGLDQLEPVARTRIAERFRRGNVNVAITLNRADTTPQLRINRPLLNEVLALARELEAAGATAPRLDSLLSVRGVIETGSAEQDSPEQRQNLLQAMAATLNAALDQLALVRSEEGRRLSSALSSQLDEVERLVEEAGRLPGTQPEAIRDRLKRQVASVLGAANGGVAEERLLQEVALLAVRADIREELDRLRAHISAAQQLLAESGAVGRRLDFLCQEFSREANTLCSKSADLELTQVGLRLKAVIEQFREQVQNIE
jgi:uncharacterized protein (TIGR00255 family)